MTRFGLAPRHLIVIGLAAFGHAIPCKADPVPITFVGNPIYSGPVVTAGDGTLTITAPGQPIAFGQTLDLEGPQFTLTVDTTPTEATFYIDQAFTYSRPAGMELLGGTIIYSPVTLPGGAAVIDYTAEIYPAPPSTDPAPPGATVYSSISQVIDPGSSQTVLGTNPVLVDLPDGNYVLREFVTVDLSGARGQSITLNPFGFYRTDLSLINTPVPEPASILTASLGLVGLSILVRRRRRVGSVPPGSGAADSGLVRV